MMIEKLEEKADVLIESLPYIKTFHSKTFVIKYGGAAMIDNNLKEDIIKDFILLRYIGINVVVVHGGGPEITSFLQKVGKETTFVNGLRVTDKETMDAVQMSLVGKTNQDIVSMINHFGGKAVGLSGADSNIIQARKKMMETILDPETKQEKKVDLGFVGDIERIDSSLVNLLNQNGYIPVIAPIGVGIDGEHYNINADEVASEIAVSLKADKLIMVTDVDGIYENPTNPATKIESLTIHRAKQMIEKGEISGGMIPKVRACINGISNGVKRTHIVDGRQKHSILLEIFTDHGIGTMVVGN
ncbi:MAG: acetylglutamate kinase [Spirochaetales bacterium]|jgi:acetylglutamate kinase|nr:acetylglutamate kinase [Spirochaetales bacterium]MBQ2294625.1 acetylglutamate kinase [Spirochaetales bacterium]MEE1290296.1 acetylglutamate kinase [Spirochaetota bacterium]